MLRPLPLSTLILSSIIFPPPALSSSSHNLPLRLWPVQESLQDSHLRLQRLQPHSQSLVHIILVISKLSIEVVAVRARRHGSAEDGLHEEAVVGLKGGAVGVAERDGELLAGELHVLGEGDAGEVEAAGEGVSN